MKKILFIAESVGMAHIVRLAVLARGLDPSRYEVHFACARFDELVFHGTDFIRWPIESLSPEKIDGFYNSSYSSSIDVIYDKAVFAKQVAEDLHLYEAIHPDLVVSDMRWSTPISAPVFGVPCANVVNAYWSRHTTRKGFPMPDHPVVRLLGIFGLEAVVEKYLLPIGMPTMLRLLAAPMNELRRKYGLPELGDLIDAVFWGDRVLFPDDPLLTPLTHQAPHETFLGPVCWSPKMPLPAFWDELGHDRPMIYATLGSWGAAHGVPPLLEALGGMDVDVVFSTAARFMPETPPRNVHVVDMIPGDLAARKAAVVVCNGGTTGYQALAEGTPIVGIPSNMDQLLSATAIRDAGAGVFLRAATVTAARIRAAVERVMREESFTQTAQRVAASFASFDPHARFRAVIDEVTAHEGTANGPIRSTAATHINGQSEPV